MGCCVSSATGKKKDKSVSGKNTTLPPTFVDKETVVQEVLSRTTLQTLFNDDSTVEKKKTKVPEDVASDNVLTEPEKVSEVSEISSLSESLLTIVNKYDEEEEVKKMESQGVRQRSPRNDVSPLKRNIEGGGGGSVRLVTSGTGKRDPTERSERKSRTVMGTTRRRKQSTDSCGGMKKTSQAPGRVRPDPNENGSGQNCESLQWSWSIGNYDSMPNDSFEEPLAALECFIFL